MKAMPMHCPSCGSSLLVKRLRCEDCDTEVEGLYAFPLLSRLTRDEQEFVVRFMQASGSLKEMAQLLGVSYPTVRNRLDEVIARLQEREKQEGEEDDTRSE